MREDYAEVYRELYHRHWWWRARERFILDLLRVKRPPGGWRKILDVGCGDGLFFEKLLQLGDVEGVELSTSLVSNYGPHRSPIHVGNFEPGLHLRGGFRLILMLDVLEHMHDPVSALRYALDLLAPDGMLLITVPAFNLLWTNHDLINDHLTRFTRASFREMACRAGLRIETDRYFFHWLFPVKLACHIAERMHPTKPRPVRIPADWINKMLYQFSLFENRVFANLSLPFGSSLLVVGSKNAARVPPGKDSVQHSASKSLHPTEVR